MASVALRMDSVTSGYRGGPPVLRGVDVALQAGDLMTVRGANGSGKTTLLKVAAGLLRPRSGRVQRDGDVGYVPQTLGLYDDLTPAENLAFSAAVFGRGAREALPGWLRGYGRVLVGDLPLGVQRRVAFAEALGHRPDLLILDEPTSGVDPLARARLWETITDAARAGAGVLVTTHYMDEAEQNCDRVALMHHGRIRALGTPKELIASLDGAGDSLDDVFRSYTDQGLDEGGFRDVRIARRTARRMG